MSGTRDAVTPDDPPTRHCDVLVLGGGPAGTWAALAARDAGASVILADKGFCGTSGATASGGNNLWHVPPGPERTDSLRRRQATAGGLTDANWMERVLETTWERVGALADWGYPFPVDAHGRQLRSSLQGPEYMRRMRRRVHRSGVTILDHHPAVELLRDRTGVVRGAAGIARQDAERAWQVLAGAVVLATGGCALLSGGYGTNVDTGDGLLMAAEAGAELSGMEFSTAYGTSAAWGVHTKGLMMQFASYYTEQGEPLELDQSVPTRVALAGQIAAGHRVLARLDRAPWHLRAAMRDSQPNFFVPLEKAGVDVFTDRFPIRMVFEGTVRGTGGVRVGGPSCSTGVPGLFVAGDVATRELITGAISGGGSHNGAWAISSGTFAGRGAASFARSLGPSDQLVTSDLQPLGAVGVRPHSSRAAATAGPALSAELLRLAQDEVLPVERTVIRTGSVLQESLRRLDQGWLLAGDQLTGTGRSLVRSRETAACLATARWMLRASLARAESRGMHRRADRPVQDARFDHRLLVGGLDRISTRPEPISPLLRDPTSVIAPQPAEQRSAERRST